MLHPLVVAIPLFYVASGATAQSPASVRARLVDRGIVIPSAQPAADALDALALVRASVDVADRDEVDALAFRSLSDGTVIGAGARFSLTFDPTTTAISFERLERATTSAPRTDATDRALSRFRAASHVAMVRAGAVSAQLDWDARALTALDYEASGAVGSPRVLGYKAIAHRRLGGVLVDGDRVVFSYDVSGRLTSIRGRWHAIASWRGLSSPISTEAALALADDEVRDAVARWPLTIHATEPIRVRTMFRITDAGEAVLYEEIAAPVIGPDGEPRLTSIAVALEGT